MMKVRVMIKHEVDPELVDLLQKVQTAAAIEVVGPEVILYGVDMTELQQDIMKVCREAEKISRVVNQVGYPWIARDILEGKAAVINDKLIYMPPFRPKTLREKLEKVVGPLTEEQLKMVLNATSQDIAFNGIQFNRHTDIETVIKIAAQCYDTLKKCGL